MFVRRPCYVPAMRAFVCEIDHHGLRRLLPEYLLPAEELGGLARAPSRRSSAIVWALLEETDAEAVRAELGAGRRREACDLLLDRAVELLPLEAALPGAPSGDGRSA
ncbi:MAG: hypothetical protein U0790_04210 [Isosphaeraceae bacterium]